MSSYNCTPCGRGAPTVCTNLLPFSLPLASKHPHFGCSRHPHCTIAGMCWELDQRQGPSQPGAVGARVPESRGWAGPVLGAAPRCLGPKGFLALPGGAASPEQKAEPLPTRRHCLRTAPANANAASQRH